MNSFVPDVPVDYVGRPASPGNLVALLLAEEACRMGDASQEERRKILSKNAADLGRAGRAGARFCSRGLH